MDWSNITNLLFLFLTALLLLYISWFIYRQIESHVWNLPPGPIGVRLVGYGLHLLTHPYEVFADLNKTYGKLCSIHIGMKRFVIVSDYDTTKELLCHPAVLSRPEHAFDFAVGNGGFSGMSGKQWALQRKLSMQALRIVGFRKGLWEELVLEEVRLLQDTIAIQKGEPMHLRRILCRSAVTCMMCLVFGRQCVREMKKDDLELIYKCSQAFKDVIKNFGVILFPWTLKYLIKFNIGGFAKCQLLMDEVEKNIRQEVIGLLKCEDNDSLNFVQLYAKEFKTHKDSETVDATSVNSLIGTMATCVQANEPTILVFEWLLYFLASRPNMQTKVQEEIDDAVGRSVLICWADRQKLPYTMACVLEMERWASIIPIPGPRCASETFQFQGYSIPKGTVILSSLWASNRDPKYWKNPDEYIPERFLRNNEENSVTFGGSATFSFGKRNCPGEKISLMVAFLFVAGIMQKFQVRTPTGEPPDLEPSEYNGTLDPKPQLLCFLERE